MTCQNVFCEKGGNGGGVFREYEMGASNRLSVKSASFSKGHGDKKKP